MRSIPQLLRADLLPHMAGIQAVQTSILSKEEFEAVRKPTVLFLELCTEREEKPYENVNLHLREKFSIPTDERLQSP